MLVVHFSAKKKKSVKYSNSHYHVKNPSKGGFHTLDSLLKNNTWIYKGFPERLLQLLALDVPPLRQVSVHLVSHDHNATRFVPRLKGVRSLLWTLYCGELSHLTKHSEKWIFWAGSWGNGNNGLNSNSSPLNSPHLSTHIATFQTHWASWGRCWGDRPPALWQNPAFHTAAKYEGMSPPTGQKKTYS